MAEPCSSWLETFRTIAPVGSWVLVIIGWRIVLKDHDKREIRKEIKALIDSAIAKVDTLEDHAVEYFSTTDGGRGSAIAASIRSNLSSIATDIKHVREASKGLIDGESQLIALRQAITSGDFDSASRVAIPESDEMFEDIRSAILAFRSHLQGAFLRFQR